MQIAKQDADISKINDVEATILRAVMQFASRFGQAKDLPCWSRQERQAGYENRPGHAAPVRKR